ncbi:hypothetical protein DPMN_179295 [Dreissena polymorpha]|uniref:Uncharacterized protein n=1 Tax=Dreissena polymorpha TaxID=45954 RepID=A0A9D4IM77_DREPO|nr:hypothetical protein DPMN_179295 [Dreissena polymorpha]
MQIDDKHDEATSPMILETVHDRVYAPSTSAHETPETVGQVKDGKGKVIEVPFFNWYNSQLDFSQLEDFKTRFFPNLLISRREKFPRACVPDPFPIG